MNKILEAILKGIQLGLEILDDELDLSVFLGTETTSSRYVDRADLLRWRRENFVDLGLPSGTLWCKWNIGASNSGTPESWYGDYYAWGEIEPKDDYVKTTYKHYDDFIESLINYDGKDNKASLDPEDDVVSVTLGKEFRMPAQKDIEELCSLQSEWVKDYNGVGGLNGRVFIGNNGNELFIPAAGYRYQSDNGSAGSKCYLWSSSLNLTSIGGAYCLYFASDDIELFHYYCYYGFTVRGILKTC